MPGDGLDLRSSLTKFSDSSLLLNHVLTTLYAAVVLECRNNTEIFDYALSASLFRTG